MIEELKEGEVYPKAGLCIIDFIGSWCTPCKIMLPAFEELSNEVNDCKFFKVNVDLAPSLVEEFKVMSVPLFVIIKDGAEVKRLQGIKDKIDLLEAIKNA